MQELRIPTLIVPRSPGVLSAFGLLVSNVEHEHTQTYAVRGDRVNLEEMRRLFDQLEALGREKMRQDRVPLAEVRVFRFADMRYVGQAYELEVPVSDRLNPQALSTIMQAFHDKHQQVYGHSSPEERVEFVNLRTVHVHTLPKPELTVDIEGVSLDEARKGVRPVYFAESRGYVDTPLFERAGLPAGACLEGPAIVEQPDTTVVVYPGQVCTVDTTGNLIIRIRGEGRDGI